MNQNTKKYLISTFIGIALMFVWIFVTVILTDGKELYEFTEKDQTIFSGFIFVELLTVAIIICLVVRICQINASAYPGKNTTPPPIPQTKYDRLLQRRGSGLFVVSFLLGLLSMIAGICITPHLTPAAYVVFMWILGICSLLCVFLFIFSFLSQKKFIKKYNDMKVGEFQQYMIAHRESAEEMAAQKLSLLKKLRHRTDAYALLFPVLAFAMAFSSGVLYDENLTTPFCLFSVVLYLCAFSRIRFKTPAVIFDENKTYVSKEEYPLLYALCYQAAKNFSYDGEIKISLLDDFNAGIAKIGSICSVQLGVILLNTLSEKELYHILLHEFAHISNENEASLTEMNYNTWLNDGGNPHFLSGFTSVPFLYLDAVYMLESGLYQYASSILTESRADWAMAQYGDVKVAASALLKTKYYDLYAWESGTYDEACFFEPEQMKKTMITDKLAEFKQACSHRTRDWNHYVNVEILSRSASHPTMKMRLDALGVTDLSIIETTDSEAYVTECQHALEYVETLIYELNEKDYDERRKLLYLEPKQLVETWESDGQPLVAEEYADIVQALRLLGRNVKANELCERAIQELPDAARAYACFMNGCFLLHSFDPSGIDYIYRSISYNHNYIAEGMGIIGEFCCLTGMQEELDIYREKIIDFAQKSKDVYSQISVLNKNDNLSTESLPEGMLENILTYILSIDESSIEKIYLVRKTVTDDFFASVFVIQFDLEAFPPELWDKVLHKIFAHLDSCYDWQFSLFNYLDVASVKVEKIPGSCVYSK